MWPFSFPALRVPRQQRLKRLAVFSFHFLLSRHRRVALGDKIVFAQDLQRDSIHGGQAYQQVCDELLACFDDPELTFSARILRSMIEEGIGGTGRALCATRRKSRNRSLPT